MIRPAVFAPLSAQDFAALGTQHLAYVKAVRAEQGVLFAVHAADGTPVALLETMEIAFAAVRQNGLEPVSVH